MILTLAILDTVPECDGHTNTHTDRQTGTQRQHYRASGSQSKRRQTKTAKSKMATIRNGWIVRGFQAVIS